MKISEVDCCRRWLVVAGGPLRTPDLHPRLESQRAEPECQPGDVVTVTGVGSWSPAVPLRVGLGGTMFQVSSSAARRQRLAQLRSRRVRPGSPLRFTPQT